MRTLSLLHFAFRAKDPEALGFFYAELFGGEFFLHPVMTGMGIIVVKFGHPEAFFQGLLEFWPWNVMWDEQSGTFRRTNAEPSKTSYGHIALKVDADLLAARAELEQRGIPYTLEPRAPFAGLFVASIRDPEGNRIEIFPAVDDLPLPEGALCPPEQASERIAALKRRFNEGFAIQPPSPGYVLAT